MNTLHRVVLVGNPNVGKSALFSRLTGTKVVSGNFPGTTLSVTRGVLEVNGPWTSQGDNKNSSKVFELIDVPGVYSLTEQSETSRRGTQFVIEHADLIINVLDATNLKRNLYLTLQLAQLGRPMIIALNMSDEAHYHGITIDTKALIRHLSAPVIPTTAVTGHGMAALRTALTRTVLATRPEWCGEQSAHTCCQATCTGPHPTDVTQPDAKKIETIMAEVQHTKPRIKRPWEYLATLTLHPVWGPLIAIGVLAFTLTSVFWLSNALENTVNWLFATLFTTPLCWLHGLLSFSPFLQQTVVGTVTNGSIDFET
ncbi:MAG: FeoB small GTPase domain-containing protein, partial [Candidatus Dependentiae bacterium]